ncbi:MAG: hypothetical protein AB8C46_07775 [Burkholderiaceae bacterium]
MPDTAGNSNNAYRLSQYVAIAELAVALPKFDIYLLPLRQGTSHPPDEHALLMAAACFAFLLLPIIALAGLSRQTWWGYLALGLFPILAGLVFGVIAVPLVQYFVGFVPEWASWFVVIINGALAIFCVSLYRTEKSGGG